MGHYIRCFNDDGKECYGYVDNSDDIIPSSSGMDDCDKNIARLEEVESPEKMIFQKELIVHLNKKM